MCPTKKLISGVIVAIGLFVGLSQSVVASEEKQFIVTAYYSPLPDQTRYAKGSYAADVKLNGEGIRAASGKEVFQGLMAGPSNYPFGTKIYLEGYGIGSIEDRGGAIVKAGIRGFEHDRIDVWMGYGDEGLDRALKWGRRTVTGKIVSPDAEVTISFPESAIGPIPKLTVNPEKNEYEDVVRLQEVFTKAELYSGDIDGEYESIKDELIAFQIETGVISDENSDSAGWYGPKTIGALRERYETESDVILRKEDVLLFENYDNTKASEIYKLILEYGELEVGPESDITSVKELQELLYYLGEYDGIIDGDFKSVEADLIDFQIQIGLIENADSWGAGYFGNKTKREIFSFYDNLDESKLELISQRIAEGATYTSLDRAEQERMQQALEVVKTRLRNQERKGGTKAEVRLLRLKNQIGELLPSVENRTLRSKLVYLESIL